MRIFDGKVYRDMTPEEITARETEQRKAELYEKSRPLTESEVSRLFITQNINTIITDDATASRAVDFHPTLKQDNSLVSAGTRINWNGQLKRASIDLWDTAENNPDNAPSLWEDINYRNGFRVIPETVTAGTAFGLEEYGWWKDVLYKSLLDANVFNPEQYPAGWKLAEM